MFKQRGFIPVLVLLVAALLVGYLIYQKQTTSPIPKPLEQPKVVDEITNWKIYTDKEFSFKYPQDWNIDTSGDMKDSSVRFFKSGDKPDYTYMMAKGNEQLILRVVDSVSFEELKRQLNLELPESTVDGKRALKYATGIYVYLEPSRTLSLSQPFYENDGVLDQILSTFKFTDSNCYYEKVICKKAPCEPILRCSAAQTYVLLPIQDLAKKLGVKEEDITVVNVEETEWNDSSLGCPKEGQFYAQVITPGYKVILSYNHPLAEFQKTYEYHTDKGSTFVQCIAPQNVNMD